jgi:hypothetical protein
MATIARLMIALGIDPSTLEAGANRGATALGRLDAAIRRNENTIRSSREWTTYTNTATRELDRLQRNLERAQKRMSAGLAGGKMVTPFSRDSAEADEMIRRTLEQGKVLSSQKRVLEEAILRVAEGPGLTKTTDIFSLGKAWEAASAKSGVGSKNMDKQIENMLVMEEAARNTGKAAEAYNIAQKEITQLQAATQKAAESQKYFNEQTAQAKAAEQSAIAQAKAQKEHAEALRRTQHGLGRSVLMFAKVAIGAASLYRLLRKLARAFSDSVAANKELSAGLSVVKGNLSVAWQAIFNGMVPVLKIFVDWLVRATSAVAAFFLMLSGMSWEDAVAAAKRQAAAIGGVGAAAKKAKGDLAAFDAINKLSSKDMAGGGGGGAGGISPDFSLDHIKNAFADLQNYINNMHILDPLTAIKWWADPEKPFGQKVTEFFKGIPDLMNPVTAIEYYRGLTGASSKYEESQNRISNTQFLFNQKIAQFKTELGNYKEFLIGFWSNPIEGILKYITQWYELAKIIDWVATQINYVIDGINAVFKVDISKIPMRLPETVNIGHPSNQVVIGNKTQTPPATVKIGTKVVTPPGQAATKSATAGINIGMGYASGAYFKKPTMGVIGEAGREVGLPLDRDTGWADIVASKLAAAMGGMRPAYAGGGGDIALYVEGERMDNRVRRVRDWTTFRSNGRA